MPKIRLCQNCAIEPPRLLFLHRSLINQAPRKPFLFYSMSPFACPPKWVPISTEERMNGGQSADAHDPSRQRNTQREYDG